MGVLDTQPLDPTKIDASTNVKTGSDTTMYTGGTPNFDEATGTYKNSTPAGSGVPAPKAEQSGGVLNDYNQPGGMDTVEGRLNNMLSKDSDYMKRAETKGKQYAQQRGLLNSSMAAGATQAASIDAALPVAQQDADWANRNRMQSDTMAHERTMKTFEQENLGWTQFIKGVSDINMQDLDPRSKEQAVKSLKDNYFAGNPIMSSLRNVTIRGGKVHYGDGSSQVTGGGDAGAAPTGSSQPAGQAPELPGQQTNPNDLLSYDSKDQMSDTQRYVFEQKYGTKFQPSQVKTIVDSADYVSSRYQDHIVGSAPRNSSLTGEPDLRYRSAITGQWFDDLNARRSHDLDLIKTLQRHGFSTGIDRKFQDNNNSKAKYLDNAAAGAYDSRSIFPDLRRALGAQ